MGNTPIQVGIKTDKSAYQYDETITGTVYLNVSSLHNHDETICNYRGIRLSFTGYENTEIKIREQETQGHGKNRTTTSSYRTERETTTIVNIEVPLITFQAPLRIAKYEYPFEWKLPPNIASSLPSSFRHKTCSGDKKGHVEIRYTVSAFLIPQPNNNVINHNGIGGCFSSSSQAVTTTTTTTTCFNPRSNNATGTFGSQTIQFIGMPKRTIPESIHIAEESTIMNGMCCCWKRGYVTLGWEADTIVLTPQSTCHLYITGENLSSVTISKLRIQLIQSIHWQAGNDQTSSNVMLVDYYIDVSHLLHWHPIIDQNSNKHKKRNDYQSIQQEQPNIEQQQTMDQQHQQQPFPQQQENDDDYNDEYESSSSSPSEQQTQSHDNQHDHQDPIVTSFQVPPDVMDSYQGHNCRVEHVLIVSAVTRFLATTPKVPYNVHIQRGISTIGTSSPSPAEIPIATAWMEETEYQDIALPSDWSPDEKVPIIHLTEVNTDNYSGGGDDDDDCNTFVATAQAVMTPPTSTAPAAAAASASATSAATKEIDGDDPLAFARPAGMESPTAPTEDDVLYNGEIPPNLQQVFDILQQMDPRDLNTQRRVEEEIRNNSICQEVLADLTPSQYQFLCQAAGSNTEILSRIAFLLATELNYQDQGYTGKYFISLMELPIAQKAIVSLIGSLTEQICDLNESAAVIEQSLSTSSEEDHINWFRQRLAAKNEENHTDFLS